MDENEVKVPEEEAPAETAAPREKGEKGDRPERGDRPAKKNFKKQNFKKVCAFCQDKSTIDYKEAAKLRKYIAEGGKILPRRQIFRRHGES